MKYLKSFESLSYGLILEKAIVFSERLFNILDKMRSPLAEIMVNAYYNDSDVVDNSYIDYDEDEGYVSWLPSNKEIDRNTNIELKDEEKWKATGRQKISIGRLVVQVLNKLNIEYTPSDVENFVNEYKALQKKYRFIIVKDEVSIQRYYHVLSYDSNQDKYNTSSLMNSCMRYENKQEYLVFYAIPEVDCKLLVLLNNENNKVVARAIIWENVMLENGSKIKYLDRIYSINDSTEKLVKEYAIKNGYWFKTKQTIESNEISNGDTIINLPSMKVSIPFELTDNMPYMDTFYKMGFEYVDSNKQWFLYNPVYSQDTVEYDFNWSRSYRSQYGNGDKNPNYDDNLDIYGNVNTVSYEVIKEYARSIWITTDNELIQMNGDYDIFYTYHKKNSNGKPLNPLVILGIDDVDGVLTIKETKSKDNYSYYDSVIADIIESQNLILDISNLDDEYNIIIPKNIENPYALDILISHSSEANKTNINLINAFDKKCAEVIIKHKPELLHKYTPSNVISLINHDIIDDKDIPNAILKSGIKDGTYYDGSIWVNFNDYSELIFLFEYRDDFKIIEEVNTSTSSRDLATFIFDDDYLHFGLLDVHIDEVNYPSISEENLDKIINIVESLKISSKFQNDWKNKLKTDKTRLSLHTLIRSNNYFDDIIDCLKESYTKASQEEFYNVCKNNLIEYLKDRIEILDDKNGRKFKFNHKIRSEVLINHIASGYLFNSIENAFLNPERYDLDDNYMGYISIPKYNNEIGKDWNYTPNVAYFNTLLSELLDKIGHK
jgi:hypothetical protein